MNHQLHERDRYDLSLKVTETEVARFIHDNDIQAEVPKILIGYDFSPAKDVLAIADCAITARREFKRSDEGTDVDAKWTEEVVHRGYRSMPHDWKIPNLTGEVRVAPPGATSEVILNKVTFREVTSEPPRGRLRATQLVVKRFALDIKGIPENIPQSLETFPSFVANAEAFAEGKYHQTFLNQGLKLTKYDNSADYNGVLPLGSFML